VSFDDIMSGIRSWRTKVRTATGRPEAVPRDTINLLRQNLVTKLKASQTPAQVSQPGGPLTQVQGSSLLSGGRPTILGSLAEMFQQQQAPQLSAEQAELMREDRLMAEREQQRVFDERQKLAKLKRSKGLSLG